MGVWVYGEKLENCPCCDKALDQLEYDLQYCRSCQLVASRKDKTREARTARRNITAVELPKLALSVRQPWAWAIIYAGKDIENRSWQAVNHGLRQRGRIAIHAAKGMTRDEYEDTRDFLWKLKAGCPEAKDLARGGIIGTVEVVDVVSESASPWFFGPRGLVLRNPEPCEFIPAVGQLGYFEWKFADASIVPKPAAWMLPPKEKLKREPVAAKPLPDLFT